LFFRIINNTFIRQQIRVWWSNEGRAVLNLDPYNEKIRKYIFDYLQDEFPGVSFKQCRDKVTGESYIRTLRVKHSMHKQYNSKGNNQYESQLGLRRVIKLLLDHVRETQCPIIGHNMMLDLCHIIQKFITPLPDTLEQFKKLVSKLFPVIIDTKVCCEFNYSKLILIFMLVFSGDTSRFKKYILSQDWFINDF
jgi:hypothetical protein